MPQATALLAILIGLFLVEFGVAQSEANFEANSKSKTVEFKIESKVFLDGDQTNPVCLNRTIFCDGLVVDFQFEKGNTDPTEICIYDSRNRKFVLLDVQKGIRLHIDMLQLLRISEAMKKELSESESAKLWVFKEFQEEFDSEKEVVRVHNELVAYDCQGIRPDDESVLLQYYEFLEKYSLIAVTDPRRMPPFARLQLNRAVKKYGLIPKSIQLNVHPSSGGRAGFTASSQHELVNELNSSDHLQIEKAKGYWIKFRQVELPEYRDIEIAKQDSDGLKR